MRCSPRQEGEAAYSGCGVKAGEILAGRFVLEDRAGMGGMSEIYRARDLERGELVAVKLLRDRQGTGEARFQREARLLEELGHPRIVQYVAHGSLPSGAPYLVMEWLAGEDLARGPHPAMCIAWPLRGLSATKHHVREFARTPHRCVRMAPREDRLRCIGDHGCTAQAVSYWGSGPTWDICRRLFSQLLQESVKAFGHEILSGFW